MQHISRYQVVSDDEDTAIFISDKDISPATEIKNAFWDGGELVMDTDAERCALVNSGESDILSAAKNLALVIVSMSGELRFERSFPLKRFA